MLAVNPPARRGRRVAVTRPGGRRVGGLLAIAVLGGCFKDEGLQTTTLPASTVMPGTTTTTGGDSLPTTTTTASSASSSSSTGAPTEAGIAFRLSKLEFVDPHVFLSEGGGGDTGTTGDTATCTTDATGGLNSVLNQDITEGNFSLMIYFADLMPGAELRLFEGECVDPMDGSRWNCTKKEGSPQTIFDTTLIEAPPCRDIDTALFQAVNVPSLADPQPPCVRTERIDFSIPVSNTAGSLNLREAQMVASPDDFADPMAVPTGIIYGFLPQVSAEGIEIEVPLFGAVNLWSVIDVPACAATYPELLPSIELYDLGNGPVQGVWLAINFEAQRVNYTP